MLILHSELVYLSYVNACMYWIEEVINLNYNNVDVKRLVMIRRNKVVEMCLTTPAIF